MSETFITDFTGRRATVILNRPERRNALRQADLAPLTAALEAAAARPEIRVLVLTGAGDKAFCAGADLDEVARGAFKQAALDRLAQTREDLPLPTICAFNGGIFGGGLDLAMACDFRVVANTAKLGLPETSLGLIPGAGGTQRLPALCGFAVARRLILGAEIVDGVTAAALGLAHWAMPAADLATFAAALAARLAARPRAALAAPKSGVAARADPAAPCAHPRSCPRR